MAMTEVMQKAHMDLAKYLFNIQMEVPKNIDDFISTTKTSEEDKLTKEILK